jgi:two-component system phosphate regulon response regulator PhoB
MKKRILLAEDERVLRRAAESKLRQAGLDVISAVDGREALDLATKFLPDLVLLDLLMPGLTGLEVLKSLREDERTRLLRVVILSNSSRDEDQAVAFDLGAELYLIKSDLSLRALVEIVQNLLRASPRPAGTEVPSSGGGR